MYSFSSEHKQNLKFEAWQLEFFEDASQLLQTLSVHRAPTTRTEPYNADKETTNVAKFGV